MPQYRVKELSLIGNALAQPGDIVEYDGYPADNLEPLDDEGIAKREEGRAVDAERVRKMIEQYRDSAVGDPAHFAATLAQAQAATIGQAVAEAVSKAFEGLVASGAVLRGKGKAVSDSLT